MLNADEIIAEAEAAWRLSGAPDMRFTGVIVEGTR